MTTLDVHTHVVSPALLDALRRDGDRYGVRLRDSAEGPVADMLGGSQSKPVPTYLTTVDARVPAMDAQGVDVQVLNTWVDFTGYTMPADEGTAFARLQNATIAEVVQNAPGRFVGSATVPLQAPERAVEVLEEAVERQGFRAVQIATSVGERYLDDPALEPFWQAAETLGVPVLVHPYDERPPAPLRQFFLANVVGNPIQTTIALARLIFSGVLQAHPRLKICFAHGGGMLPYQLGRVRRSYATQPAARSGGLHTDPLDLLRRCYYDTVLNEPRTMRYLADLVGHERLVMGSDYPFEMGDPDPCATVAAAFAAPEREAVLGGTLAAVLGLTDA